MRRAHDIGLLSALISAFLCFPAMADCIPAKSTQGGTQAKILRLKISDNNWSNYSSAQQEAFIDGIIAGSDKWNNTPTGGGTKCNNSNQDFAWITQTTNQATPVDYNSMTDILTIRVVFWPGQGTCGSWDATSMQITLRLTDPAGRECPLKTVLDDVASGSDAEASNYWDDLLGVVEHEVGHALGLGDNSGTDIFCAMSGLTPDGGKLKKRGHVDDKECDYLDEIINAAEESSSECSVNPLCEGGMSMPPGIPHVPGGHLPWSDPSLQPFPGHQPPSIADFGGQGGYTPNVTVGGTQFFFCYTINSVLVCLEL